MKFDLTIYELGQLLKGLSEEYKLELLTKIKLSGGWMTATGIVEVLDIPKDRVTVKGNNIISLKLKNDNDEGGIIKITGAKDGKFSIDIASTRYKIINASKINLDKININETETKLRIDEDMIFTINSGIEEVINYVEICRK